MGWGKAISAVVIMSISVMLVVSVLPVGAAGKDNAPLMMRSSDCALTSDNKCQVWVDRNHNDKCDSGDKIIMLPKKVAMGFRACP